jgi:hypothetical protein
MKLLVAVRIIPTNQLVKQILDVLGITIMVYVPELMMLAVFVVGSMTLHVQVACVPVLMQMEIVAVILEQDVLVVQETADYCQRLVRAQQKLAVLGVPVLR